MGLKCVIIFFFYYKINSIMMNTSNTSQRLNYLFEAKLDNVKNLSPVLKAINFKDNATIFINDKGLKVVVEDSKCVQASAFVGEDLFQEFHLRTDQLVFCLDLTVMVECLSILDNCSGAGTTTALNMYYKSIGSPLKLLIEEGGIITDCSLKTKDAIEILDFDFPVENELNKIIFRASDLKEILSDIDTNSESIEILISPNPPYFRITTNSVTNQCYIDIPNSSESVEIFSSKSPISAKYKYTQLKPALRLIAVSSKTSIRINEEGLLCFQFMIKTVSKLVVYVEYLCTPLVDDG